MSIEALLFNINASRSDRRRDRAIPIPAGVTQCRDLRYRGGQRLDVYYPEGAEGALPTIVSIHGGGYVYGNKEIYRRYCMDLARRGFAVVNFNYRLAPRWKFPAPLEDTNAVMEWICGNAERFHLRPDCIFLIGDSAGAQLASQYAAIRVNSGYAALFPFRVPEVNIRALGLNCGVYDLRQDFSEPRRGLALDYLGKKMNPSDPRFDVLGAIDGRYPPAHITTAWHDFLRENAQPMCDFLTERGVHAVCETYGSEERRDVGHVFHVNIALEDAGKCSDSQCAFFRKYV